MKFPCYCMRLLLIKSFGTTKVLPWKRSPLLKNKKKLMTKGIVTIGDHISHTSISFIYFFFYSVNVLNGNLSPINCFKLIGIVNAIPSE